MISKELAHDCEEPLYQDTGGMTTCVYYPPVYNERGINTNPDGNITSGTLECLKCTKKWSYKTQYSKTTYKAIL